MPADSTLSSVKRAAFCAALAAPPSPPTPKVKTPSAHHSSSAARQEIAVDAAPDTIEAIPRALAMGSPTPVMARPAAIRPVLAETLPRMSDVSWPALDLAHWPVQSQAFFRRSPRLRQTLGGSWCLADVRAVGPWGLGAPCIDWYVPVVRPHPVYPPV